ncbi:dephospho-CoA kinase [Flavobacterium tibetense]|jgi:dephospho-CoA kinase|uniref:Dephospho-CoA kinase n=1 Tax=Flavobacterium tibetense TaxID=2233533 RepID=A0A365P130_9FLAO|nr:dephospho-CoA kinase [Flavobacterium tibetense]RBA28141.1 dephospho-CoA kinase [Flavobacterium tibetense]
MTKIIGLTGGIGSGKSTVASYIASKGIPVYIADEEAKKIMELPEVISEVQQLFDEDVLLENNQLNRTKIAEIVFKNPQKLQELNAVIHPKVKLHFINWLKQYEDFPFVVKEVAILFETGGDASCDKIILVTAPEEVRIQRVMQRDKTNSINVKNRIKNQLSDKEKKAKSDFVIENIDMNNTMKQVDKVLKILNENGL